MPHLPPQHRRHICDLYASQPLTSDNLPYTPQLTGMCRQFEALTRTHVDEGWMWTAIQWLRKRGLLPRKRR